MLKKSFKVLLALTCVFALVCTSAFAAVSLPSISSSKPIKCYTLNSSGKVYAYTDSSLKTKTGGYIACATDECQILKISGNAVQVKYPVSKGTKTAWFSRKAFTNCNISGGAAEKWTQNGKISTVYKQSGKVWSGSSVSSGDVCYKLATNGNYTQILYPISGGYKMAWVKTSDIKKVGNNNGNNGGESKTLTNALYGINVSGSKITCGYDGYVNTSGRHEGIDFKYAIGKPVYSLTDGKVLRVASGHTGSGGLSTIAIYNASANKTVIYLHSAPISSLEVGDTVKKGQQIATESWRGVSVKDSAHTHVEVRNGEQRYAAKSVGDYTLDNPNPKSFWNSMGYTVE